MYVPVPEPDLQGFQLRQDLSSRLPEQHREAANTAQTRRASNLNNTIAVACGRTIWLQGMLCSPACSVAGNSVPAASSPPVAADAPVSRSSNLDMRRQSSCSAHFLKHQVIRSPLRPAPQLQVIMLAHPSLRACRSRNLSIDSHAVSDV